MRTPTELVDELVRELLPCEHGVLMIDDVERRADEFAAAAFKAEPGSPQRVIGLAIGDCLRKLHRSIVASAFRS